MTMMADGTTTSTTTTTARVRGGTPAYAPASSSGERASERAKGKRRRLHARSGWRRTGRGTRCCPWAEDPGGTTRPAKDRRGGRPASAPRRRCCRCRWPLLLHHCPAWTLRSSRTDPWPCVGPGARAYVHTRGIMMCSTRVCGGAVAGGGSAAPYDVAPDQDQVLALLPQGPRSARQGRLHPERHHRG